KVDPIDRPVVKSCNAEGATVAHALAEHFPRVTQLIAVLPRHLEHLAEMLGLGFTDTEGEPKGAGWSCVEHALTRDRCGIRGHRSEDDLRTRPYEAQRGIAGSFYPVRSARSEADVRPRPRSGRGSRFVRPGVVGMRLVLFLPPSSLGRWAFPRLASQAFPRPGASRRDAWSGVRFPTSCGC